MYRILFNEPHVGSIGQDNWDQETDTIINVTKSHLDSPTGLAASWSVLGLVAIYAIIACVFDLLRTRNTRNTRSRGAEPESRGDQLLSIGEMGVTNYNMRVGGAKQMNDVRILLTCEQGSEHDEDFAKWLLVDGRKQLDERNSTGASRHTTEDHLPLFHGKSSAQDIKKSIPGAKDVDSAHDPRIIKFKPEVSAKYLSQSKSWEKVYYASTKIHPKGKYKNCFRSKLNVDNYHPPRLQKREDESSCPPPTAEGDHQAFAKSKLEADPSPMIASTNGKVLSLGTDRAAVSENCSAKSCIHVMFDNASHQNRKYHLAKNFGYATNLLTSLQEDSQKYLNNVTASSKCSSNSVYVSGDGNNNIQKTSPQVDDINVPCNNICLSYLCNIISSRKNGTQSNLAAAGSNETSSIRLKRSHNQRSKTRLHYQPQNSASCSRDIDSMCIHIPDRTRSPTS